MVNDNVNIRTTPQYTMKNRLRGPSTVWENQPSPRTFRLKVSMLPRRRLGILSLAMVGVIRRRVTPDNTRREHIYAHDEPLFTEKKKRQQRNGRKTMNADSPGILLSPGAP